VSYGHGIQSRASDTPSQKSKQPQQHSSSDFMMSVAYDMMATFSGGSFGGYFRYFGITMRWTITAYWYLSISK
jgi:hypothetical protein